MRSVCMLTPHRVLASFSATSVDLQHVLGVTHGLVRHVPVTDCACSSSSSSSSSSDRRHPSCNTISSSNSHGSPAQQFMRVATEQPDQGHVHPAAVQLQLHKLQRYSQHWQQHTWQPLQQQAVGSWQLSRAQLPDSASNGLGSSSSSSSALSSFRCFSSCRAAPAAAAAAAASTAQQHLMLEELRKALEADESQALLTPTAVVQRLDRVIVGQDEAKRAVAVAYRNRWRRQRVQDPELREEISPKNLLLIGPTGCGKTEIARRLAKLAEAPFIKVEATKFTEVGYHGRDVDSIVRDLVEVALTTVKARCRRAAAKRIAEAVESHILHAILGEGASLQAVHEARERYRAGELEDAIIDVDVPNPRNTGEPGITIQGVQASMFSIMFNGPGAGGKGRAERRSMSVAEARPHLEEAEAERQFPAELLAKEAVRVAEQEGIVFIDEIDKIVNPSGMLRHGSDPSAEGVQRDLLPLIEGSVVTTKHGPVATDHVLFIASGAFTSAKPSDMMAELQGRLPIRVELQGLTAADFERILTEPECNMIYQQQRLMGCEGVELVLTPEAIQEVAAMAEQINKEVENIGARRLHTVLERLVEDISFEAPDKVATAAAAAGEEQAAATGDAAAATEEGLYCYRHVIDKEDVQQKLADLVKKQDLGKYIL